MFARRLLLLLTVAVLPLAGCAAPGEGRADAIHSAGAGAEIARRARLEAGAASTLAAPDRAVASVPPGVDAMALARRRPTDRKSGLSLEEALAELSRDAAPANEAGRAPPGRPPASSEEQEQALGLFLEGREAALDGRHQAAVTKLEAARRLDPDSPWILRELARAYLSLDVPNPGRSLLAYQDLLRLEPDDSESLLTLALAAAIRRDFAAAAAAIARGRQSAGSFAHDPTADLVADDTLHTALRHLGYDRAAVEAGLAAVEVAFPIRPQTIYRPRIASIYRRRGDTWRAIGDARCRLGLYAEALDAFAHAAALPISDPGALHVRVVYANLMLGRVYTAQHQLLAALRSAAPAVRDRDVRLCEYVARSGADRTLLARAVLALVEEHPDSAGLARAAALLVSPPEATRLLERFVSRRPRDLDVVGQLLLWLGPRDAAAATELTAALIAGEGDLGEAYARRLLVALPPSARPTAVPASAAGAVLDARLSLLLRQLGAAWDKIGRAIARWPEDLALRLLLVETAGRLDEPALVRAAWAGIEASARDDPVDTARSRLVLAQALHAIEQFDEAAGAAALAVAAADRAGRYRVEALVESALLARSRGAQMPIDPERALVLESAATFAREAQRIDPTRDEPYAVLTALHGRRGLLADPSRFRAAVDDLRRASATSPLLSRLAAREDLDRRRYQKALERALSLYDADPSDRESMGLAIAAWRGLGRAADAESWLRRELDTRPGDRAVLDRLVRMLIAGDRAADARTLLDEREALFGGGAANAGLREVVERAAGRAGIAARLGEERLLRRPEGTRRALQLALIHARAERPADAVGQLAWIADHVDLASERHLTGAIGLGGRLVAPRAPEVLARLVERTVERFPGSELPVYAEGLLVLAGIESGADRFEALAAVAARGARGADDSTVQGVLPWRDLAQRLVDAGHPGAAARVLRVRLRAGLEPEPILDLKAVSLLTSMILAADAAAPDRVDAAIELLVDLHARHMVPALPGVSGEPTLAAAFSAASDVMRLAGNDAGSRRLLRESIRRDPTDPMTLNNVGYDRIEAGRGDAETVGWIEYAATLAPEETSIVDTLAWLRYKQGRLEDRGEEQGAFTLLVRVLEAERDPSAEVLDHHGDVTWRMGRTDDAVRSWRRAVRLLEDTDRRDRIIQNYRLIQSQVWGLLVADPETMYDRDFGVVLERAKQKLTAVERGSEPPVAPTFDELAVPRTPAE